MAIDANSYGTKAGMERLIGDIVESRTFGAATVPTETQMEAEIDAAAMDLNRELDQAGYTVPVVNADFPTAYGFLKAANEYGAAAVLLSTVPWEGFESAEDAEAPATSRAQTYANKFKNALTAIQDHRLRATMRVERLDRVFSGSQEDDDGNTKLPIFTRGMDRYPGRGPALTES